MKTVLVLSWHHAPYPQTRAVLRVFEIVEGVIRSAARMTYNEVHAILEGNPHHAAKSTPRSSPGLSECASSPGCSTGDALSAGSIDFDLPEPVIEFNAEGEIEGVTRAERTWANRLIEEFMLAANECVATWLEDLGVPSVYRIHEKPDPRRVVDFEDQAAAFGYSLGLGALPVKKFQPRGERREQQRSGRNTRDACTYESPGRYRPSLRACIRSSQPASQASPKSAS